MRSPSRKSNGRVIYVVLNNPSELPIADSNSLVYRSQRYTMSFNKVNGFFKDLLLLLFDFSPTH
jgi:hypothetical protein